jgi:anti-anti-sigma factor
MSITNEAPRFEVVTHFDGSDATVVLRGSVENAAASALGAALDAAIDRHPTAMTLDLAQLEFMGPAGLIAVTNAENRLSSEGVMLKIQSPSALVNRLLGIMELAERARRDESSSEHGHLGPEQMAEFNESTQRFASSLSTKDLRRVTGMPTDPDVVDGALHLIVDLAHTSIGAADGVSVSLMRHGALSTVAASDQTIMAMDANQYATGEGPCVDASVEGHWFHAESLDTEVRWPSFTPRARSLGIKAILSSPLKARDEPVGALNIYSRTAETFEVGDQKAAAVFAERASVILSDARAGVSDTQMAIRFQEALRSREMVSLAKGIIMERDGVDAEEAFNSLLHLSLADGVPLLQRATTMIRSALRPEIDSGSDHK